MLLIEVLFFYFFFVSCFFFQAEDGIRGSPVTGVQTCALPICDPLAQSPGLANVDHRAEPVAHEIHSGLVG